MSDPAYGWHIPNVSPSISLSGGVLQFAEPAHVTEVVAPGLKLVLVLDGQISYRLRDRDPLDVQGPAFHLSLSDDPFTVHHRFGTAAPLQYVTVCMPADTLTNVFGMDMARLSRRIDRCSMSGQRLTVDRRANRLLMALGRQMLLCPMQGAMRNIYLSGKALELTATVMSGIDEPETERTGTPLNSQDVRKLRDAQDILLQRLQAPPTLPELARLSGTNVNKLTLGFRQLFGCSVYDFVREQRLELAYRMLAAGGISVADAALACGYTDSHFTKAFRKRYGVAPSALH
ncbi:Regulatory protein PchR [Variovorax boronicumulans]|uniref:helix-turn-helix transcriptional regulator n=1 Tax=Variovorax boronicumulans TaxID=436515 RepID=UPI000BB3AE96|nr:AraC family transcriptional regulator [Variovorax boronicumulans]PBI87817.1 Regulatory protein PchR [Variovorax boronicumulans]